LNQAVMHRMKKNMILLVPMVMFQSMIWSQGNSNSVDCPLEFSDFVSEAIANEYFIGGDLSQLTFNSGKPWKVWCSHANTMVFQEPDIPFDPPSPPSLDFLQQVIVTGVDGEWLQVKTPNSNGQPIGWVKSAYLMLSPFALKTSGGVGRKALVVPNLELQSSAEQQESRTQLYNHPNVSSRDVQKGRRAKLFRVLYVFKETDSAMLLGVTPTIEDGSAGSVILGWMPKQYLTEWNRRVAYGPVYGEFAEASVGEKIPFFLNQAGLSAYETSCQGPNGGIKLEVLDNPTIPLTPAFPDVGEGMRRTIENKRRELLAIVGSSTTVVGIGGIIEMKRKLQELKDKIKNVNLLFVVDATASMGRYFPEIARSITSINEWSTEWGAAVDMRIGFGIYRDYPDCPNECWDNLGEIRSYDSSMASAIQNIECKSKGTNRPEAVYQGILENLSSWFPNPQETNIVVLIGDEGNHISDEKFNEAEVREELERINASLYAFQATAFLTESSMGFQSDVLGWMNGLKEQNEQDGVPTELKRLAPGVIGFEFANDNLLNTRRAKLVTQGAQEGAKTDPAIFAEMFKNDIENWLEDILDAIEELNRTITGTGGPLDPVARENIIRLLIQQGFTREQAEAFLNRGGDLATRRYASVENCKNQVVLLPYVFLTRREYNNITQAFSRLEDAGTSEAKAEALYDMCLHLIQVQVGDPKQAQRYLQKTMGEIWIEFFQVDFNIASLRDVQVANIKGEDVGEAFDAILTAYETWEDLEIDRCEWSTASAGKEKFYWVEARYFPGFEN